MTEEEWKAFDKSKGTTVYVKRERDGYPEPWQIESHYPRGATLSRIRQINGKDDQKDYTSESYQRLMTKKEAEAAFRNWEEKRREAMERTNAWKAEERVCPICGKKFKPVQPTQKTCSTKCQQACKYKYIPVQNPPKACVVCGKTFFPKSCRQLTCSAECRKKRKHAEDRAWGKNFREKRRKAKEQKDD